MLNNILLFGADIVLAIITVPFLLVTQYSGAFYICILLALAVILFRFERVRVTSKRYLVRPKTYVLGFLTTGFSLSMIVWLAYGNQVTWFAPVFLLFLPVLALMLAEKIESLPEESQREEKRRSKLFKILFWLVILPPVLIVLFVMALSIGMHSMSN